MELASAVRAVFRFAQELQANAVAFLDDQRRCDGDSMAVAVGQIRTVAAAPPCAAASTRAGFRSQLHKNSFLSLWISLWW